jgi:hypothetical protein
MFSHLRFAKVADVRLLLQNEIAFTGLIAIGLCHVVIAAGLLPADSFAESLAATGSAQGVVFTRNADGSRAIVPGAKISLLGATAKTTEADASGGYAFTDLPPGSYVIEAESSELTAIQTVTVAEGRLTDVPLEMKVKVSTTVTVSASPNEGHDSAAVNAIGQSAVETLPNVNQRFEDFLPLVPGVIRGSDGTINMKGARSSQNGSLVNSADVTDPVTGTSAIRLPIDVVSSVHVLSSPYDPEYGKFTGAVSNLETRTGNFHKFHGTVQNLLPRPRVRDGDFVGLEAVTPRMTFTTPVIKDRIALTQSLQYWYERVPVNSLPPLQSDTRQESFTSYTQVDWKVGQRQTATASFALFPQRFDYYGLNTFTPQEATPNLHERGYQAYLQHRYIVGPGNLLSSQLSFRRLDADVLPNSGAPYQLLVETTEGGFFNRQDRRSSSVEWQEIFQAAPRKFYGSHELKAGISYVHSSYDGYERFWPVDIVGVAGYTLQKIQFSPASTFSVNQNEEAWFAGDKWTISNRLVLDLGLRFDHDSIANSLNTSPRVGFALTVTNDGKTLLKGGAGVFYNRIPLDIPVFPQYPNRTVASVAPDGQILSSTNYINRITGPLRDPRSEAWNIELDRQVLDNLLIRASYQQRNTVHDFVVSPVAFGDTGVLSLANQGHQSYREFQVTGRYQIRHNTLNASYTHSRAYGDLNDFNQFFGNDPQPVIRQNQCARLPFDAPNRFLVWGQIAAPWKLTVAPILDVHTGFPYSAINQAREFVGPRNDLRFPRFASTDVQVLREITLPFSGKERHALIGATVFNIFNRYDPRDVQSDVDSYRFNQFFNGPGRVYRGKFVLEF